MARRNLSGGEGTTRVAAEGTRKGGLTTEEGRGVASCLRDGDREGEMTGKGREGNPKGENSEGGRVGKSGWSECGTRVEEGGEGIGTA